MQAFKPLNWQSQDAEPFTLNALSSESSEHADRTLEELSGPSLRFAGPEVPCVFRPSVESEQCSNQRRRVRGLALLAGLRGEGVVSVGLQ